MAEETVFSDNNVNITTTRIIISGTTYALRNITSVKMATTPAKKGCAIVLLIVGILALLGSFGTFSSDPGSGFVALLFAAAILAGAIFWLRSCKPEYHVAIASSSGEAHALTSKDRSYIEKVVGSINDAITRY
jgi:hypothetical protein